MKQNQKKIVLDIVRIYAPIRTEQVKIEAMRQGVSCADRYLRWLSEEGKISSQKKEGDKTKTWYRITETFGPAKDIWNAKPIEKSKSILGINKII